MKQQSRRMFDASTIPDDLMPIAATLSTALTGDWRSIRPVVDQAKCVECAVCWAYCPPQCIVQKEHWFEADLTVCKGCGVCAIECPHNAITMVEEVDK